jgi:hypothetical protein
LVVEENREGVTGLEKRIERVCNLVGREGRDGVTWLEER